MCRECADATSDDITAAAALPRARGTGARAAADGGGVQTRRTRRQACALRSLSGEHRLHQQLGSRRRLRRRRSSAAGSRSDRARPLERLARSKSLWERRIAIVATHHFIRAGEVEETFRVADILLHDEHDLIHKAVGWMLREAGKRDRRPNAAFSPRVTRTCRGRCSGMRSRGFRSGSVRRTAWNDLTSAGSSADRRRTPRRREATRRRGAGRSHSAPGRLRSRRDGRSVDRWRSRRRAAFRMARPSPSSRSPAGPPDPACGRPRCRRQSPERTSARDRDARGSSSLARCGLFVSTASARPCDCSSSSASGMPA